ncbi:RNA polymerase Rpc34 [Neohortaea acidophila]|uniref:DNA-directed RNA polymerase III subunit RPC6 n=1 Tax=Neohortaea acidophila TaxID=245834 RepID=A0A6A6PN08_9PEZI|nr:RNA polymerase Rpc34 [Neohortaea acidophila]KAF2481382.1 RNA polymerase Rpc34 [Neohortaea acidophila]
MAESKAPESELGEALYDICSKDAFTSGERYKKTFTQDSLLALCTDFKPLIHVQDARKLLPLIQELCNLGLFIPLKNKTGTCWALRPRDAAAKMQSLSDEQRRVYQHIEEAHEQGIWIRNLKTRTGIKDGKSMAKMLGQMANMRLIKSVTNVKSPAQKHYILFHLAPSDELTGGSFYDKGDLDQGLIDELSNLIVFHVRQTSWVEERKKRIKKEASPVLVRDHDIPAATTEGVTDAAKAKKRKRDATQPIDIEDAPPARKHRVHRHASEAEIESMASTQQPFPAGHEYQTAASIHEYITSNNIIRAGKAQLLTVDEVQNVLNVLLWDGKLEKVNGGYRSVRGVKFRPVGEGPEEDAARRRGNAITEMPCGQCPVFHLCGTGGPVNAENCVYLDRWLGVGVAAEG